MPERTEDVLNQLGYKVAKRDGVSLFLTDELGVAPDNEISETAKNLEPVYRAMAENAELIYMFFPRDAEFSFAKAVPNYMLANLSSDAKEFLGVASHDYFTIRVDQTDQIGVSGISLENNVVRISFLFDRSKQEIAGSYQSIGPDRNWYPIEPTTEKTTLPDLYAILDVGRNILE